LTIEDLSHLDPHTAELRARDLIRTAARTPFDLQSGPLLRLAFYNLPQDNILLIVAHHSITDGWSMGILSQELSTLYAAYANRQTITLPPLPIQYADYSEWQRTEFESGALTPQLSFWKSRLNAAPPTSEFPADRPRPALQTFSGARESLLLPADLVAQLQQLSQQHGATLFMSLTAAFNILLSRYSGQDDIVLGTPIAGRTHPETEPLIGLFVNTLALRTDLSGDPPFSELLARVRKTTLDAYANQDIPFERLVEELNPARDLSRSPFFQSLIVLQNTRQADLRFEDLSASGIDGGNPTAKFDTSLYIDQADTQLRCTLEFNTDLFNRETIAALLRQYQGILQDIAQNPSRPISHIDLLTPTERHHLLVPQNQADYPKHETLNTLVRSRASQHLNAPAVHDASGSWTYAELLSAANAIAVSLSAAGVSPGDFVGISLDRSRAMAAAMLAVLDIGGAYVPIDPSLPQERIAYMIEDSGLRVMLTDSANAAKFSTGSISSVIVEDALHANTAPARPAHVPPQAPAYIRYTSGSTGKPKGVIVPHQAVVNFMESMRHRPGISQHDRLVAVTTLSFDISELEIWLPLLSAAQVYIADRETTADATALTALLRHWNATVMQATPATWRMLVDSKWAGSPTFKALCGGEALPQDLADQLLTRCGELWNMYGPTETTIWSAVSKVEPRQEIGLGEPIANTQFFVCDRNLTLQPVGAPGELLIGGDGLALGYHNREDLTRDRFVTPHWSEGRRLYRTGDLVRMRRDGRLEYLGRIDNQVKIRGFRIELGEIESALNALPHIRESVVSAIEDPSGKKLVAYVVPATPETTLDPSALRSALKNSLPDYMVPSAFVTLAQLPLSANGKIDRKALPAPYLSTATSAPEHLSENAIEATLLTIWS
ncbi:MAG: amino acid adenylation domain-containing protein, partial [Acidobacteriales bacterium]|nr:amino acid adenylation domain-containing protein [Terriglobales bacterium]